MSRSRHSRARGPAVAALLVALAGLGGSTAATVTGSMPPRPPVWPVGPAPGAPHDLAEVPGAARASQPTWQGTSGLEALFVELRDAIAERGRWPKLGPGPTLELGDRGGAVVALRARLIASGLGPAVAPADPLRFDDDLDRVIRAFQYRVGLEPDGKVGPATRVELDRSPRQRLRQVARTIASRRALPADLGPRFVLLNLPAFELEAFEAGRPVLRSRVVVGAPDRPTPELISELRVVVVHPRWNVPARIARDELAPRAADDPGWLERQGFEILDVEAGGESLDPRRVDWDEFGRGERSLRLRQRPGPGNALGTVNLRFPNRHHLSFHDTPERKWFERARRDRSHGCIRVARALDLARWALRGEPRAAELERALAAGDTAGLRLSRPVPVYIVDWPVWIDADGHLQTRAELYPHLRRSLPETPLVEREPAVAGPPAAVAAIR